MVLVQDKCACFVVAVLVVFNTRIQRVFICRSITINY
jgi:hypothetical protein